MKQIFVAEFQNGVRILLSQIKSCHEGLFAAMFIC